MTASKQAQPAQERNSSRWAVPGLESTCWRIQPEQNSERWAPEDSYANSFIDRYIGTFLHVYVYTSVNPCIKCMEWSLTQLGGQSSVKP